MTDYKKLLNELFAKYDDELALALDGDIEQYCYKEVYTKENGTHDANYKNRLRLAYEILYTKKYEEHNRIDGLIVKLFNEELFDRETNSFQGIGTCLEILTELLNKYNVPDREVLFERAKNANFDCYCGLNVGYVSPPLDEYTIEESISLLIELGEKDLAKKLLLEYTYSEEIIDESKMNFCQYNFHILGDLDNEFKVTKNLINMAILSDDSLSTCRYMFSAIKVLNDSEAYDKASEIFDMLIPRLNSIDSWDSIGFGRQLLEQCMTVIINYESSAEDLWEWAEPFIRKMIDNMHGNLYKKASLAAYKMGDFMLAETLSNKYDELMFPLE